MSNETKGGDTLQKEVMAKEVHAKARSYYDVAEQYAYKFLMELKTLRDEKLFRELGYKTFAEYCDGEWEVSRDVLYEKIQLAERFGEKVSVITDKIGHRKSLLLSRLDEETRTDAIENGIPTKSGRKPVESATQQEIAAYQRSLKEKDAEIAAAKRQADIERKQRERLEEEVEHLSEREPETVTEYIEVTPEDYEQLKKEREEYARKLEESGVYSDEPYGVKLGMAMYGAFEELSKWQKEYSWILTDTTEFQKLVEADPNFAREFSRLDKFWNQMSKAFHGARDKGVYREEGGADVIDADFTEII